MESYFLGNASSRRVLRSSGTPGGSPKYPRFSGGRISDTSQIERRSSRFPMAESRRRVPKRSVGVKGDFRVEAAHVERCHGIAPVAAFRSAVHWDGHAIRVPGRVYSYLWPRSELRYVRFR